MDQVECLICHKMFKQLCTHMKKAHGISMDQYREQFPGAPVVSAALHEQRVKLGKSQIKHAVTPEANAKKAEAQRRLWQDEAYRQAQIAKQSEGKVASELYKTSHRDNLFNYVNKLPKTIEARREFCGKMAKAMWADPQKRLAQEQRMSILATERLKDTSNKWNYPHGRFEYKGVAMRSSWEVSLAAFLDRKNIEWLYEPHVFEYLYEGRKRRYTPDFYLVRKNVYLEVRPASRVDAQLTAKLEHLRSMGVRIFCVDKKIAP